MSAVREQGAAPTSPDGLIRARTDGADRLIAADEPLAGLQLRSGGTVPGEIALPALLALVRRVPKAMAPRLRSATGRSAKSLPPTCRCPKTCCGTSPKRKSSSTMRSA